MLTHPPDWEGPILFSYREKVFFGKKRAAVRVENGDWSEKFALDAAGSTGLVECKADGLKYEVSLNHSKHRFCGIFPLCLMKNLSIRFRLLFIIP